MSSVRRHPKGQEPTCPACGVGKIKCVGSEVCIGCAARVANAARHKPSAFDLSQDGPPPSSLFDEQWATFTKYIGRSAAAKPTARTAANPNARARTPPSSNDLGKTVIFHTSDWHCPYLHLPALAWSVEQNRDADVAIVGGDIFNAAAASRFIEASFEHPRDELAQAMLAVQMLAETFPRVILRKGNHDDRIRKYFAARIPPYLMFLVQANIVQFLAEGLRREGCTNIEVSGPQIDGLSGTDWFTPIGDAVFMHAETHSKIRARPAENAARWMRKWSGHLQVKPRVFVQEHNHTAAMAPDLELDALLIQAPCLSENHAYQAQADIKYGPNTVGCVRIVQDAEGRTLPNESRYLLYDGSRDERAA